MNLKDEVLKTYEKSNLEYIGNSNSLHELGLNSKKLENASSELILKCLGNLNKEVIYTSGNTESYNLILNSISDDKEIITDNEDFYDIGIMLNKNIKYGDIKTLFSDKTYLISTCDLNNSFPCLKHIDISFNYNIKSLDKFDYITIEDEIPFLGVLIKDKNKELIPLIHGGKSTTKYRSGTASTSLIASFAKLLKLKYKK